MTLDLAGILISKEIGVSAHRWHDLPFNVCSQRARECFVVGPLRRRKEWRLLDRYREQRINLP
jgi:hypothetical protein